jgi:putative inorganic carbon (hco3(-)) transporter
MSGKSDFVDYEPLRRPRRTDEREREDFPSPKAGAFASELDSRFAEPLEAEVIVPSHKQPKTALPKATPGTSVRGALKRGHAVSFAGLFLFTVVLYFRPYELFPFLSWTTSAAFWIAVVTVAIFIPTQLGLENQITTRPRELKLLFFLVLAALLSVIFASDPGVAWMRFTEYLKVVLMFVVMINVVRTKARLKALLILVLIASIFFSVAAINDYRLGNLVVGGERVRGIVGGMFQNPNDLALHLVTMVPIGAALFLSSRNIFTKLIYAATAITLVAGIVVTFSRGGFIGLAVTLAVFFAKVTRGSKVVFGGVILVVVLAFMLFAPGGYGGRLSNLSDMSATNRQDDLKRSIYLTIRHPIFGIGMDNFQIYSNHGLATHNAYTQVSVELGVFAAVCYVLFIMVPVKATRRIQKETDTSKPKPWEYYFAIGIQASLIGYMVSSFFASVAFLWYVYYLVGYAICIRRIYEASNPISTEPVPVG